MTLESSVRPIHFLGGGVPFRSMKTWKIVACLIPVTLGTSIAVAVQAATPGYTDGHRNITFRGHPSGGREAAISAWLDWCATGNHQQTNPNGCVLSWTL